jgi:hypothetical protein
VGVSAAPRGGSPLVRPTAKFGSGFGRSSPVSDLNELEYAHGWVLANIWYDPRVAIIDPGTGSVVWYLDFAPLLAENQADPGADCLNGLAYTMRLGLGGNTPGGDGVATEAWGGRLWVTGKRWGRIYEVELGGLVDAAELVGAEGTFPSPPKLTGGRRAAGKAGREGKGKGKGA